MTICLWWPHRCSTPGTCTLRCPRNRYYQYWVPFRCRPLCTCAPCLTLNALRFSTKPPMGTKTVVKSNSCMWTHILCSETQNDPMVPFRPKYFHIENEYSQSRVFSPMRNITAYIYGKQLKSKSSYFLMVIFLTMSRKNKSSWNFQCSWGQVYFFKIFYKLTSRTLLNFNHLILF